MKKLLLTIAVVALTVSAFAQSYGLVTLSLNTNAVVASSAETFTSGNVIDCRKQKDVAIQVSYKCTGANSGVGKLVMAASLDGTTNSTAAAHVFNIDTVANGTTIVSAVTNINVGGYGYLKALYFTNGGAATGDTTNLTVRYAVKIGAP